MFSRFVKERDKCDHMASVYRKPVKPHWQWHQSCSGKWNCHLVQWDTIPRITRYNWCHCHISFFFPFLLWVVVFVFFNSLALGFLWSYVQTELSAKQVTTSQTIKPDWLKRCVCVYCVTQYLLKHTCSAYKWGKNTYGTHCTTQNTSITTQI